MGKLERIFLKIAGLCSEGVELCGIYTFSRKLNKNKITLLMYHGITARSDPVLNFDYKHVERDKFEEQLRYLKKYYSFINMEDFMKWKEGKKESLPKNSLLLTFDDGYANCYTQLFPLLKKYSAPAAIFLPTEYIGKKGIAWYDFIAYCIASTKRRVISIRGKSYSLENDRQKRSAIVEIKKKSYNIPEERQIILKEVIKQTEINPNDCRNEDMTFLSWEQCREMQKTGVRFGSHSITHRILTELTKEEIDKELLESKKIIEEKIKRTCNIFAYPFGSYNKIVEMQLKKTGYALGLTIGYGKNTKQTENMEIKRIPVNNLYDLPLFALNVFGHFMAFHHCLLVQYNRMRKLFFKNKIY